MKSRYGLRAVKPHKTGGGETLGVLGRDGHRACGVHHIICTGQTVNAGDTWRRHHADSRGDTDSELGARLTGVRLARFCLLHLNLSRLGLLAIEFEDRRVLLEHQLGDRKDQRVGMIGTALAAIALRGKGAKLIFEHGETADVMNEALFVKRRDRSARSALPREAEITRTGALASAARMTTI
jgi:hypothetical protein